MNMLEKIHKLLTSSGISINLHSFYFASVNRSYINSICSKLKLMIENQTYFDNIMENVHISLQTGGYYKNNQATSQFHFPTRWD